MYRTCTGDARKTLFGDSPPSLLVMWCKTVRRLNLDQSVPRLITPTNQNEAVELRLFGQRGCRTMRSDRRNSFGPALTAGTLLPACTPCELSTSSAGVMRVFSSGAAADSRKQFCVCKRSTNIPRSPGVKLGWRPLLLGEGHGEWDRVSRSPF